MLLTFLGSSFILNAFSVCVLSSRLHNNKNINLTGLGIGLKKDKVFWQVQKYHASKYFQCFYNILPINKK